MFDIVIFTLTFDIISKHLKLTITYKPKKYSFHILHIYLSFEIYLNWCQHLHLNDIDIDL